ncbi:probable polygalacturonase At3g15720 [Euphorbia lathyris]|uniref:probable polygalacturonase At3g15720 n=1 Tax=Euphorbia lathyris TaxID=212925 RepID=UPI003313EAC5
MGAASVRPMVGTDAASVEPMLTLFLFWINTLLWSCHFLEARTVNYFDTTDEEEIMDFKSRIPEFHREYSSNPSIDHGFLRSTTFNVLQYGAKGDALTDDSQAFLSAWRDACELRGRMTTVEVPVGRTYLLKPLIFEGPCIATNIHFQIQGRIVAPNNINAWDDDTDKWIQFKEVNGLLIDGRGTIDGQGEIWWKLCHNSQSCSRPTALSFHNCNGLQLSQLKHMNSQRNHISINSCHRVDISGIYIIAPKDSPNTDGIDISASSHISIKDSIISTGDDCIAINGFSSMIKIAGVTCGPGHGISVGSLGKDGAYEVVEDVHVQNCTFKETQNGVRIKTWKGGSGYAKRISFEHITLIDSQNPIIINQNYINHHLVYEDRESSDVHISDITYRDIHGTSADEIAIDLNCGRNIGCRNIVMENVDIISAAPQMQVRAFCNNADGFAYSASPYVPCLSMKAA